MKKKLKQYEIETEISKDHTIAYIYQIAICNKHHGTLKFPKETSLYDIAKCIAECFEEEDLEASFIEFEFYENYVYVVRDELEKISESTILEVIARQIK